jgi:hypothetical protein
VLAAQLAADRKPRTRKCAHCRGVFEKRLRMQKVCGLDCAIAIGAAKRAKDEAKAYREARERIKPRGKWVAEAQAAFNEFIRLRDAALPCISCDRHHEGSYDAGHYLTTGAKPELRFDEANVHKQCVPCNRHLHGNLVLFRAALLRKVGQAEVDRLEGPQQAKKHDIPALREIRDDYRARVRAMKKGTP